MQDIIDRLQAELGDRPSPPPGFEIGTTIGAGRRAVRRRRLAVGGAALALALVVGGAGVAVTSQFGGGHGGDSSVQVAAGVSSEGLEPTSGLNDDFPAGYDPQDDHALLIRKGWEVVDRIDGPVDGLVSAEPITDSVALAMRKDGDITWVLLYRYASHPGDPGSQGGGGLAETPAESGYDDLTSWLAHQMTVLTEATR